MFNSPILDVTIGLVFIFLLYSLLATSVNEAISTGFALRARMLKRSITKNILSNTPTDNKILSFLRGIVLFLQNIVYRPEKKPNEKNIGDQFYDHPIIKNYGSSRFFKDPSYLTSVNFSTILTDVLKEDFTNKLEEIALFRNMPDTSLQRAMEILNASTDIVKIKNLMEYYAWYYAINPDKKIYSEFRQLPRGLDKETHCILQMYLRNSLYTMEDFRKKIEQWYDDSQERVTGWYKRHMQFILFCLGIFIAIAFNVDTVEIVHRLSTDEDARAQTVQLAIQAADAYKDDPRIQPGAKEANNDTLVDSLQQRYQRALDNAKKLVDSDINKANELLALGWGDYGRSDTVFLKRLQDKAWFGLFYWRDSSDIMKAVMEQQDKQVKALTPKVRRYTDSLNFYKSLLAANAAKPAAGKQKNTADPKTNAALKSKMDSYTDSVNYATQVIKNYQRAKKGNTTALLPAFYDYEYKVYPVHVKTAYVWYALGAQKGKWAGFLLTAFAICLGAPFWFDLLNKLVKVRATGKKEGADSITPAKPATASVPVSPETVNVNTQNPGTEEAVG